MLKQDETDWFHGLVISNVTLIISLTKKKNLPFIKVAKTYELLTYFLSTYFEKMQLFCIKYFLFVQRGDKITSFMHWRAIREDVFTNLEILYINSLRKFHRKSANLKRN